MKLKEFVESLSPGDAVRIGAKNGSGWFFAGTVGSIDWRNLDKVAISRIPAIVHNQNPFVPVQDRQVVEHYASVRNPDVTNIVIDGREVAREKDDVIKMQYKPLNDMGVVNIAIAAVKSIACELMHAIKMRDEAKDPYIKHLYADKITECERLLRDSDIVELLGSSADALLEEIEGHRC